MKILGLDIETTGLSASNSDLLEVGLVLYDTDEHSKLSYKELNKRVPKVRILVHRPTKYLQGNLVAFGMHQKNGLLDLHKKLDTDGGYIEVYEDLESRAKWNETFIICKPDELIHKICFALFEHGWIDRDDYARNKVKNALTVAGKNVAGFDLPYLREYISNFSKSIKIRHRVFDPTPFFFDLTSDRLPDLQQCIDFAVKVDDTFPANTVKHTAVDDAMDIINLIHLVINKGQDIFYLRKN